MFWSVANTWNWPSCVHSVSFPIKYFPASLNDSIFPKESVDNDADFHGDGTGEEDEGDLFCKELNTLLLQLTDS